VIISFFFLSPSVYAIVNLEDLHLGTAKPGLSGNFNFSIDGAKGNVERLHGSLGSRLQWFNQDVLHFLTLNYAYGKSFEQIDRDKAFLHVRRIAPVLSVLDWEIFSQLESNHFTRLQLRALAGGGLRFKLRDVEERFAFFFGTGSFYSIERLTVDQDTSDAREERFFRANLYGVLQLKLGNFISFLSTTYYQPRLDQIDDFRLLEDMGFNFSIGRSMKIRLAVEMAHDNHPPQNVTQKTDIHYSTRIFYSF